MVVIPAAETKKILLLVAPFIKLIVTLVNVIAPALVLVIKNWGFTRFCPSKVMVVPVNAIPAALLFLLGAIVKVTIPYVVFSATDGNPETTDAILLTSVVSCVCAVPAFALLRPLGVPKGVKVPVVVAVGDEP